MLFAFYDNFTPDDLICKIVVKERTPTDGEGATLQFNGNEITEDGDGNPLLSHRGRVTVGGAIARAELLERISAHALEASDALGGIGFPLILGSPSIPGTMLDRLFLYAYAIEQAKRSLRGESALPPLYSVASFEELGSTQPTAASSAQGFVASARIRRAIELRAMDLARDHLAKTWDKVEDVSGQECFDFLCMNATRELHVEVKGTTLDGAVVLLTRNEVEHARSHSHKTALIIVSHIEVRDDGPDGAVACGGRLRTIEPWHVDDSSLVPLTYACAVAEAEQSAPRRQKY